MEAALKESPTKNDLVANATGIDNYDFSELELHPERPICYKCGEFAVENLREKTYECKPCGFSISEMSWQIVTLHSATIDAILRDKGIEKVTFHGVPIDRAMATQPTHLLPAFLATAQLMGEAGGLHNSLMINAIPLEEEALNTPNSLLGFSVMLSRPEASLHESLQLVGAATLHIVEDFHQENPQGSVMDSSFIFNYKED